MDLIRASVLLLSLALASCMVVDESSQPYGRVGIALPDPETALDSLVAPEQLGDFRLQGTLQPSERELKLFRYVSERDESLVLEFALYPIPGGWEDLPPLRMVDGHFAQIREQGIVKLARRSRRDVVEVLGDSLSEPELLYPIAVTELRSRRGATAMTDVLMLTADAPLFVRLRLESGVADASALHPTARDALIAFVLAARASHTADHAEP
ncbi:MAG: hypothetical protein ACK4SX_05465 [Alcanivoracaceae bacterium]